MEFFDCLGIDLQKIQNKVGTRDPNVVSTWEVLIKEWDSVFAQYRAAVEDCARMNALSVSTDERERDAEEALARLSDIKLQIDQLITDSDRRRAPIRDSIVVADLETGEVQTVSVADAPDRKAVASASKGSGLVDWILRRWSMSLQKN